MEQVQDFLVLTMPILMVRPMGAAGQPQAAEQVLAVMASIQQAELEFRILSRAQLHFMVAVAAGVRQELAEMEVAVLVYHLVTV